MTQPIAIVRQKYNPTGGAERFVSRALIALLQRDTQVCLISRQWQTLNKLCVLQVNPFYVGSIWRDYGFARAVKKLIKHHTFALVQTHERIVGCDIFRAGDGVHAVWLQNKKRACRPWQKLAVWCNPYHHYLCQVEKAMFADPRLKAVICNSRMVQQEIHTLFQLPISQLPIIYNGIDTTTYHPDCRHMYRNIIRQRYDIPDQAPVLLYVGSGFSRKGVARVLEAVVPFPDIHVIIVGEDKHQARYIVQAKTKNILTRCHFVGAQHEVLPFYGAADAFILPTLYDPFPNAGIEALACGLPVLTSLQCGVAELITQGVNGWVCDVLDQVTWQQHIGQWLALRSQWPCLQANARQIAGPLTLDNMTKQLCTLYETLLPTIER